MTTRVLLVHGAATTPRVWDPLLPLLAVPGAGEVMAPLRPSSGDLATELAFLADLARGSLVVGVSGGATLGLALLASEVRLAGAVLHEPAVGSLVPGLLDHVVAGWESGGVAGFASALYGPGWTPDLAPADPEAVARDLGMFRRFQPARPLEGNGPVVTTVGALSPPPRQEAARVLTEQYGITSRTLPGTGHFVQRDNPAALAAVVREVLRAGTLGT